jgi:amino acid transporter
MTGIGIVAMVYVAIQTVCIGTVANLVSSERPLSDAGLAVFGTSGATLVALGALVSIGGTLNALMFATPRLVFAMAEHGQLPPPLRATHPRFQTPANAIVFTAVIMLGLTLFSTFLSALTISAVVRLIAYTTTCAALPVLRRRAGLWPAAFVVPGGIWIAAAAIAVSAWLLSNSAPRELGVAAVAAAIGLSLYWTSTRTAPA